VKQFACRAALLLCLAGLARAASGEAASAGPSAGDSAERQGWRIVRAMDCARCHGPHYTGLAAPSIVAYAKTQSRERFVAAILRGDPGRGMPGYANVALVADHIEQIHAYFKGRAEGRIAAQATWSACRTEVLKPAQNSPRIRTLPTARSLHDAC